MPASGFTNANPATPCLSPSPATAASSALTVMFHARLSNRANTAVIDQQGTTKKAAIGCLSNINRV